MPVHGVKYVFAKITRFTYYCENTFSLYVSERCNLLELSGRNASVIYAKEGEGWGKLSSADSLYDYEKVDLCNTEYILKIWHRAES